MPREHVAHSYLMIFEKPAELEERIRELTGRRVHRSVTVTEDTSNYMGICAGAVLRLAGSDYYVTGDARETRFGIQDQPKFWVKYVVDLTDGSRKIVKLVFHERFTASVGPVTVRCVRRPEKESEVLASVVGDHRFMQGRTVLDSAGNNVRIIDRIRGDTLFNHVASLEQRHEEYFCETAPAILRELVGCIEALDFLHRNQLQHGDVRNDHILIESETGRYRWIDFDYWVNYPDYDIWSVGNILTYVVGKGIVTCREAANRLGCAAGSRRAIGPGDALLLFKYRLANLRKAYPYIPEPLNDLLMRFSVSTTQFYECFADIARDLRERLE